MGQEITCRYFAKSRDLEVVRVFSEDVSGRVLKRPVMNEMLDFVKLQDSKIYVVFSDLNRMARNLGVQHNIEELIVSAGGIPICPNVDFSNNADSRLIRNLIGSVNAHQVEKNAENVREKMWNRARDGIDIIGRPKFGYVFTPNPMGKGSLPVPHEHNASIAKGALEGYANGTLRNIVDVMNYINDRRPVRVEGRNRGKVFRCSHDVARKLIERASFYAGKINYPQQGIKNVDGKHEPLIDMQTAIRVKERKAGRGVRVHYKQNEDQYPLKGSLICAECGGTLTTSGKGSAGENKKHYMYYVCKRSDCSCRHKGIYVDTAHQNFSELLSPMRPDSLILNMTEIVMREVWKGQIERLEVQRKEWSKQHRELEVGIDGFMDDMIGADRQTKNALKRRISEMETDREKVKALLDQKPLQESDFNRVIGNVFDVLANPQLAWEEGELKRKRTIQRLVFPKNIFVKRDKNFRKPQKALLFRLTEKLSGENRSLVVGNGLSSNFSDSFLEEFQSCNDLFEHPPIPIGKQYVWEPLSTAA